MSDTGSTGNNVYAEMEVQRLAAIANGQDVGFPEEADLDAERMTRAARLVVGAALAVGIPGWFAWSAGGGADAPLVGGVSGLLAAAVTAAILWRMRRG